MNETNSKLHNRLNSSVVVNQTTTAINHAEVTIWAAIFGSVCFAGMILNVLALTAVWKSSVRLSGFNFLLGHYISLNLLMCVFVLPSYVALVQATMYGQWIPADICSYVRPITSIVQFVANWCDPGMALNRLVALFFPLAYKSFSSKSVSLILVGIAWLAGLLGHFIPVQVLSSSGVIFISKLGECSWSAKTISEFGRKFVIFITFGPYGLSLVCACLLLFKSISYSKRSGMLNSGDITTTRNARTLTRRLKRVNMLLFILLWQLICLAPLAVGLFLFEAEIRRHPIISLWLRISTASHYAFTPGILLIFNDEYRRNICRLRTTRRRIADNSDNSALSLTNAKILHSEALAFARNNPIDQDKIKADLNS